MTRNTKKTKYAFVQAATANWPTGHSFYSYECNKIAKGFKDLGYEVIPFQKEELWKHPKFSPLTPIRGTNHGLAYAYQALGLSDEEHPEDINVPECLLPFARRKIEIMTVKDFGAFMNKPKNRGKRFFVKPQTRAKTFSADSYTSSYWSYFFKTFSEKEPEFKISVQEELLRDYGESETRFHVLNHKLVGLQGRSYHGCETIYSQTAEKIVDTLKKMDKNAPPSYYFDLGMFRRENEDVSQPTLIEFNNPMTALHYINATTAARIVESRWRWEMKRLGLL